MSEHVGGYGGVPDPHLVNEPEEEVMLMDLFECLIKGHNTVREHMAHDAGEIPGMFCMKDVADKTTGLPFETCKGCRWSAVGAAKIWLASRNPQGLVLGCWWKLWRWKHHRQTQEV